MALEPHSVRPREHFSHFLDRVRAGTSVDRAEFLRLVDAAGEDPINAIGFRHHAVSTQHRQDRHLQLYQNFIKNIQELPEDISDEELDQICFPPAAAANNFEKLFTQLQVFLGLVVRCSEPVKRENTIISYATLVCYRDTLIFWINGKYHDRNEEPPSRGKSHRELTETMRYLAREHGMSLISQSEKPYLGTVEILQLIDMDTRGTPCIELAEGHHLAWLLGRYCALRPGSIAKGERGDPNVQLPFLAFRDVEISRGAKRGEFNAKVMIRNLKTNSFMDAERGYAMNKKLTFYLKSPQDVANLVLSVPHRILVIALRRQALEGIETLEQLLDGTQHNILFKQSFLNKPIILAGTERGLGVVQDKPLSANSLTTYLALRGKRMGYGPTLSFMAIRRQSATDYTKILGRDQARELMAHDPDSRTLEKHYLNLQPTTDVSAIVLGENLRTAEMELDSHEVALSRMTMDQAARNLGPELNALTRQLAREDPYYPITGSTQERKNRDRILRRIALSTLVKESRDEGTKQLTQEEFEHRKLQILNKACAFNAMLLRKAKAALSTEEPANEGEDVGEVDFNDPFPEDQATPTDVEADAEDEFEDNDDDDDVVEVPEEHIPSGDMENLADVPYDIAASEAMQMMYENGLSEIVPPRSVQQCPLCFDDEYVDEDHKNRTWKPAQLKIHMATKFHSKNDRFFREVEFTSKEGNKYHCPYCVKVAPPGVNVSLRSHQDLRKHIERSNKNNISQKGDWTETSALCIAHDELKSGDGWYDEDFTGDLQVVKQKRKFQDQDLERWRRLADKEVAFSDEQELRGPQPVPGHPGLQFGSFTNHSLFPAHMATKFTTVPFPPGQERLQQFGNVEDLSDIPEELPQPRRSAPSILDDTLTHHQEDFIAVDIPGANHRSSLAEIPEEFEDLLEKVSVPSGLKKDAGLRLARKMLRND